MFFSSIFALMLLTRIPIDVHLVIDIHLHMTFPLVTTILAYMGIFFVLRKRARVDFQRQTSMPSNPRLLDRRRLETAQMERKIATTSFLILLFLIISIRSTRRSRSTENPLDRLQLRWLGNISIRSFTGWDFRSASG